MGSPAGNWLSDLQAVILAGYGNRLHPLTDDDNVPKALLPVANKPMIGYALDWLEEAGISEILVITPFESMKTRLRVGSNVEVVVLKHPGGTVDALRGVRDRIKKDFLVVSCDFITTLQPHVFLDFHRIKDSSMTCLHFDRSILFENGVPSDVEDDIVTILDPATKALLYIKAVGDLKEELSLPYALFVKYPQLHLARDKLDAHLYVFKRWVIDYIMAHKELDNIRSDLVPQLALLQHSDSCHGKDGVPKQKVRCFVYEQRTGLCGRANTIATYRELSRQLIRYVIADRPLFADTGGTDAREKAKTPTGPDSLIADSAVIGERVSVKKSCVGENCTIGKNCRIVNSIIMDNCEVKDGVKLENTIMAIGSHVGEKAQLKDCVVAAGFTVKAKVNSKSQTLMEMSDLFE